MAKVRFQSEWRLWAAIALLLAGTLGYLYWVSRPPMEGGQYLWNVVRVIDGRSLSLRGSGNVVQFRLIGLQIPKSQEKAAQEFVSQALEGQWVRINPVRDDPQGGKEGFVYLSGEDLVARLIRQGLAQIDRNETGFDVRPYMELEQEAKRQQKGLWSQSGQEVK
jgi:micrococcal nuclease